MPAARCTEDSWLTLRLGDGEVSGPKMRSKGFGIPAGCFKFPPPSFHLLEDYWRAWFSELMLEGETIPLGDALPHFPREAQSVFLRGEAESCGDPCWARLEDRSMDPVRYSACPFFAGERTSCFEVPKSSIRLCAALPLCELAGKFFASAFCFAGMEMGWVNEVPCKPLEVADFRFHVPVNHWL